MKKKSPTMERLQQWYWVSHLLSIVFFLMVVVLVLIVIFTDLKTSVSMLHLFFIGFLLLIAVFFRVLALELRNRLNQKEAILVFTSLMMLKKKQ